MPCPAMNSGFEIVILPPPGLICPPGKIVTDPVPKGAADRLRDTAGLDDRATGVGIGIAQRHVPAVHHHRDRARRVVK